MGNKFISVQTIHQTHKVPEIGGIECQQYRSHLMHVQDSAVCTLHTKQVPQPGGNELTESTFLGADYTANRDHSAVVSNSRNKPAGGQTT